MLDVYGSDSGTRALLGSLRPNETLEGFQELGKYSILRPTSKSSLYIDDSPIPTDSSDAYWEWSPGFCSGRVAVEVSSPDVFRPQIYFFEVSADKNKVDTAQFRQFLEDIAEYLPEYLLGSDPEPAQAGVGGKSPLVSLWIAYARFKANAEAYLTALQAISERPITRLKYLRESVDISQAKRIDAVTIGFLRSNPSLLNALAHQKDNTLDGPNVIRDTRVNVPFHDPSVDNPPNRLILRQIKEISRQNSWLQRELVAYKGSGADAGSDLSQSTPRRLRYLSKFERKLRQITNSETFTAVASQSSRVAGLNAVSANPVYDRTHKLGLSILKKGISELSNAEMQYLSSTWRIYEAWCFCVMASALKEMYPDYDWALHRSKSYSDSLLEGRKGNRIIRLYDQLVCPSLEKENSYGYISISRERRPDFVLEIENQSSRRFVCLDAKYRVSRPGLLEAMASAHIYQNSIKLNGNPPLASCLIAPNVKNVERLAEKSYLDNYNVSCFALGKREEVMGFLLKIINRFDDGGQKDN